MLSTAKSSSSSLWVSPLTYHSLEKSPRDRIFLSFSNNPCLNFTSFATRPYTLSINTSIDNRGRDQNAEILRYCELGNLQKAIHLMLNSEKFDLDERCYCSILQLCAELNSLDGGKRVHSAIRTNNVEVTGVLGSKLVFMYLSCRELKEARRVFDEIECPNVFLWNFLMNEYAKIGAFDECVLLFRRMLNSGIGPDSYTMCCIFKCFAALGSLREGEAIHGHSLKLGFGCDNKVINSLIAFYFRCGKTESAQNLFDELCDRDVVSWNSMISGYVANGMAWEGVKIFHQMLTLRIGIDLVTMAGILAACADIADLLLTRIVHAYAIKVGFDRNIKFDNSLLDVYSKCGDMHEALSVFRSMDKRNAVSFTSMILGYAREGLSDEAIDLLREMRKAGVPPDVYAVTSMLQACAVSCSLENGKEVHDYIRESKMESDLFVCNALMDMYAKCRSMENANMVFSQMTVKDIVSWNTMIGGYSKNSLPHEALDLFVTMQQYIKPDDVTVTSVLPACASLSAFLRGREIHGYILRNRLSSDRFVSNALIDMYIKCGALGIAQVLFGKIASKDLVSWTIMIAGYGMHGFGKEAMATFKKMRRAGIEPNEVSFLSILYACSHSGLLQEGWRLFNMMRNVFNIVPNLDHYSCMVDLLSRAGKLSRAYKLIQEMPIKPNATIWGTLLYGCRVHGDVKLAEQVAEHVFELEPENTGYYVLLSNIYAEAEKWEAVKEMQQRIANRPLKGNTSYSWIEIRGKVHVFSYHGKAYPEGKRIKFFLSRMSEKMVEQRQSYKWKNGIINAAEMENEIAVCKHTERLAIAYGVVMLPRNRVIRVTKNLRMCGDCHEMAKFISKEMEREIILRDSNRFHHFKDGSCSCRGYW